MLEFFVDWILLNMFVVCSLFLIAMIVVAIITSIQERRNRKFDPYDYKTWKK